MTAATQTTTASRTEADGHRGTGWADLVWITWRQHRLALAGTGGLLVLTAVLMVVFGLTVRPVGRYGEFDRSLLDLTQYAIPGYAALIAVFWAAPLLAREYEQRTHLLAWGQDVSPLRWLTGKTAVLAGVAVVYAVVLGLVSSWLMHRLRAVLPDWPLIRPFSGHGFESSPLLQAGYALFGFALGLAVSAISRRTVVSMGITLALFAGIRVFVIENLRPYFMTPVRSVFPLGAEFRPGGRDDLFVGGGMLDAAGNEVDPARCAMPVGPDGDPYLCERQAGAVSHFVDVQPADRLAAFQLIEFGLFAALAVVLAVVTWRVMRRSPAGSVG
ncbi:hypothetical protein [Amycolatopsis suaedae]|uniref:ABC transporter permease n=1 Tax=Amycolatopsis suaedae TaxID=2510978 RepID=A0A4Q7J5K5_9PSEU|nr:hypothetical protein [Amycolatopsis suaedae]RZQ62389.1 hypothetical protein EWH70_19165 [Amycolatopsis suaedae]